MNKNHILKSIPQEIIQSFTDKHLAIFIGAGLSMNYSIPDWNGIKNKLVKCSYDNLLINKEEYNAYYKDDECKKVITVLYNKFKENNKSNLYYEVLDNNLDFDKLENKKEDNIYKILKEFLLDDSDIFGLFLTTNVDNCFDKEFDVNKINMDPTKLSDDFLYDFENSFESSNICLYHLHGSIKDHTSLVFTEEEYEKRYNDRKFKSLLTYIFKNYTVLFIGYSLRDKEIIDFLMDTLDLYIYRKHYIFMGYLDINEKDKLNGKFNKQQVEILPYAIVEGNHDELKNIILKWKEKKEEIFRYSHGLTTSINKLFEIYEDPYKLTSEYKQILEQSFKTPSNRIYLFKKLSKVSNRLIWFNYLNETFFNKDNSMILKICYNNDFLDYIRNIARLNSLEENENININIIFRNLIPKMYAYYENNDYSKGNIYSRFEEVLFEIIYYLPKKYLSNEFVGYSLEILKYNWNNDYIVFLISDRVIKKLIDFQHESFSHVLKIILSYKESKYEIESKFNINDLIYILLINTDYISNNMFDKSIEVVISIINEIINKNSHYFYQIVSIKDNYPLSNDNYVTQITYLLRDLLIINNNIDKIRVYSKKFFESKNLIYRRISIYLIDHFYDNEGIKNIFWKSNKNPLNYMLKTELSNLFRNNNCKMNTNEILKLDQWIENIEDTLTETDYDTECKNNLNEYKYNWYKLLNITDDTIDKKLNKYKEYDKNTIDFDKLISEDFQSNDINYYSLFLNKSNEEIVKIINKENIDLLDINNKTNDLKKAINNKPNKFINDIDPFLNLNSDIKIIIFDEISEMKNLKYTINLIKFIKLIIKQTTIEDIISSHATIQLFEKIISYTVNLLLDSDEYNSDINQIIVSLNNILVVNVDNVTNLLDEFNLLLNNYYQMMIIYILKNEKDNILLNLEKELQEGKSHLLFASGKYLTYLYDNDINWFNSNMKYFINDNNWKHTLSGYLMYSKTNNIATTEKINLWLKENNLFVKAIENEVFRNENIYYGTV